jgi:outer membrane protein assembly factor BamB
MAALDATGAELFRPPTSVTSAVQAQVVPGPFAAYTEPHLVVADQAGIVSLVSSTSGAVRWQTASLGDRIQGTPTVQFKAFSTVTLPDDLVFIGTSNSISGLSNRIVALRASDGTALWTHAPGNVGLINGSGVVDYDSNRVYFASRAFTAGAPTVWALSSQTGAVVWSLSLDNIDNSLSRANNTLYASSSTRLYAIDLLTGTVRWSATETVRNVLLAFPGNTLFYSTGSTIRMANDPETSTVAPAIVWTSPTITGATAPTATDDTLYVGSATGALHALRMTDGTIRASRQVVASGGQVSPVAIDILSQRLFVGSLAGRFVGFPLF